MQSLDTNVVLRLIVGDVETQRARAMELVQGSKTQLAVADIVFVELEYALTKHYEFSRKEVASLLGAFAGHPKINCNRSLITAVLAQYVHHPALSFTDIALSVYADLNQATPLWTFDKKLATQSPHAKLLV